MCCGSGFDSNIRVSDSFSAAFRIRRIRIRTKKNTDPIRWLFWHENLCIQTNFFPVRNEVGTGSAFGSGSAFLGDARTILKLYFLSLNTQFAGTRISWTYRHHPRLLPDYVDRNRTGKEPNYLEPGLAAFVAGYLRQITFSAAFPKLAAEVRWRLYFVFTGCYEAKC